MTFEPNNKKSNELTAAAPDQEFRKTNEAIGLRVSEGRLSLLSRKIFNALVFHAQKLGEPGKNAPIDTETAKEYFWIPLGDIARDSSYESNDTKLLKEHVNELQNVKVIKEDDKEWTSERLVSSVKIVNPSGLKKKGGRLWIGFLFPPEVSSLVLNPGAYTKLSIYYQNLFRSGASLALYEVCRRYATNPSHVTSKEPWEWWHGVLSGNPLADGLPEYKYFKRDQMKPAISEINSLTDIKVELVEFKDGRKIVALQFKVYPSAQQPLDFPGPPVVDGALIAQLMNLGISKKDASDLFVSTEESLLRATLKLVEDRMANKAANPLEHPAAYFRDALRKGYAKASSSGTKTDKPKALKEEKGPSLRERYAAKVCAEAIEYFNELDEAERDNLLEEFKNNAPSSIMPYLNKSGLKAKIVQTAFAEWLAIRLWGEPTETQLLEFAEANLK